MTDAAVSRLVKADDAAIARAGRLLAQGGLVAFPTETVYGLGADARDDAAVARIFAAKDRPRFNPLIVHVRDYDEAAQYGDFPEAARALAAAFWPGPLTLVVPRKADCVLSLLVSAGMDTVALRAPSHPLAQRLLEAARLPIAAPSANRSGRLSPTRAKDVADSLGDEADLILDGGDSPVGVESTVVGFEKNGAVLLRPGGLAREEIEPIAGPLRPPSKGHASPGQLKSHYAPRAAMRLDARKVRDGEALLAFGPHAPGGARAMRNLSAAGDLRQAAANLFVMLRALDATGAETIAVMPVPNIGLGEAINDRLLRAAAPREAP